jgi:hypothetical protein
MEEDNTAAAERDEKRAAAKHTAKNANLKKTRASYYSGATADAELPFRISAKRAFHSGRPINGD